MDRKALPVASFEVDARPSMEMLLIELSCVESPLLGGPRVYAVTLPQAIELRARLAEEIEALQHATAAAGWPDDRSAPGHPIDQRPSERTRS
jgi:hypothetical protein